MSSIFFLIKSLGEKLPFSLTETIFSQSYYKKPVCGSALSSSFSELGHRWCLHSQSRLFYVIGCVLWPLRSQTTASLIWKQQGTQTMYTDKPALQNIAHCLPGLVNVFSHTSFQNKLKKGYPPLAVQQDIWPRAPLPDSRMTHSLLQVAEVSQNSF